MTQPPASSSSEGSTGLSRLKQTTVLNLALFATGLAGIVAEYILATMATYFLGNSVLQWTLTLSLMLFAMGLGSRLSKQLEGHLLEKFLLMECALSLLASFSAMLAYSLAAYYSFNGLMLYGLAVLIGLLIGMEIPLVVRINEGFTALRRNISGAMEKDYYGSLLGGVLFLVGLPFLGLTYLPFVLGSVNFLVAALLYWRLRGLMAPAWQSRLLLALAGTMVAIVVGAVVAEPVIRFAEQQRYRDKVVFSEQTPYQQIVLTQWKEHYWFYLNGNQQLSTWDEHLYPEPMVLPIMHLHPFPKDVLILGGGDGAAAREVLKFGSVESITLVDLDPRVTQLAQTHPIFLELNQGALNDPRVTILNQDAFTFLEETEQFYDVIIADFPDPKSVDLSRLFSLECYRLCYRHLRPNGLIVAQAGSPYYASKAFYCVEKTLQAAGFQTVPLHNQVLTLGEWGWQLGSKSLPADTLKARLRGLNFEGIPTRWLDAEAMLLVTSFGKELTPIDSASVQVNTHQNPVLPGYYRAGNWDFY